MCSYTGWREFMRWGIMIQTQMTQIIWIFKCEWSYSTFKSSTLCNSWPFYEGQLCPIAQGMICLRWMEIWPCMPLGQRGFVKDVGYVQLTQTTNWIKHVFSCCYFSCNHMLATLCEKSEKYARQSLRRHRKLIIKATYFPDTATLWPTIQLFNQQEES